MRLPQTTTQRLMIAVAIAAMLMGGARTWKRYEFCRGRVAYHELRERHRSRVASRLKGDCASPYVMSLYEEVLGEAMGEAHLKRVYQKTMWRPWEAVPPEPEPRFKCMFRRPIP